MIRRSSDFDLRTSRTAMTRVNTVETSGNLKTADPTARATTTTPGPPMAAPEVAEARQERRRSVRYGLPRNRRRLLPETQVSKRTPNISRRMRPPQRLRLPVVRRKELRHHAVLDPQLRRLRVGVPQRPPVRAAHQTRLERCDFSWTDPKRSWTHHRLALRRRSICVRSAL